ncbi:MAG TPA: porin family protein [Flavisolibacter sp.]|nr:porin family protein [Flavisolibacter sp.]
MKMRLSVLLISVLFAQAAMAQFRLGIKGGANITKIEGKAFREEFKYGYHLGGFAEIGLGGRLSIQPEVLFNQFQTTADTSFRNVYENAVNFSNYRDVKLNYLSIPLMLNYKVGSLLTLQAGPQFGILIDQSKNLLENGEEAFKNGDFSLAGGAVITISKLRLTGRYFAGLSNVSDISDQNKWKNQGFQLSVGFAL